MLIEIDFSSDEAIYQQLCNQIILGIATEQYTEGMVLPSVRQLAEEIGINMHTVNKAYTVLKQEGFVKVDRRRGAVICVDSDKMRAVRAVRGKMQEVIAESICRGLTREEMHELLDTIYDEYEAYIGGSGRTGSAGSEAGSTGPGESGSAGAGESGTARARASGSAGAGIADPAETSPHSPDAASAAAAASEEAPGARARTGRPAGRRTAGQIEVSVNAMTFRSTTEMIPSAAAEGGSHPGEKSAKAVPPQGLQPGTDSRGGDGKGGEKADSQAKAQTSEPSEP